MGALIKIWQCYITIIIISVIFKKCQSCTPSTPIHLSSVASDLVEYIRGAAKDVIPAFNASAIPNIDTLNEQFNAASENEDIHLNITQILKKYGYPSETHQVNSDGYILDIFRIPSNGKKTTVLIGHGLFGSSDDFVTTGADRGLAYVLADEGYDVWLCNARGNVHGRKHVTLSPKCAEFWDFSVDEIGRSDVPATIDYILKTTGQEKLAYVGFSQGCVAYFIMASEKPEYNDKVSVMVALSAVSYLKFSSSPVLNVLAPVADPFYLAAQAAGLYEFLPRNIFIDIFTSTVCSTPLTSVLFCYNPLTFVTGANYPQVNATILPPFFGHAPGGGSTKQLVHYLQLINSGKFGNFDYGPIENLKRYDSVTPPDYPLNKITSKMVVFYSDSDVFSTTSDRERFLKEVPNVVETYRVPSALFGHSDYLIANDLKTLVNDKVVNVLKKHT